MSWKDNILYQVFDPRLIGQNLLDWFAENQVAALAWANNDTAPVLPPVVNFFPNDRTATKFPVCMLSRAQYRTATGEDIAHVEMVLQYEIILMHGKQDWLAVNTPKYAMAFESMTKNIPKTSLENGSKIVFDSGTEIEATTTFDFLKTNGSQFMQSFTTQVNWQCDFSNYPE